MICSIMAIARKLLERNDNNYDYVLTYRFSQDQVDMFFSKICSRLGWNNNPTAIQFKWALRTSLQKNQITAPTTGNCKIVSEDKPEKDLEPDNRIVRLLDSSVWRDDVLGYIGGYIVKQLIPSTKCVECLDALVAEDRNTEPDQNPSRSVVRIVQVTDKILRERLHQWHLLKKQSLQAVKQQILRETQKSSRPWSSTPENAMFLTKTYVMTTLHSLSTPFSTSTLKSSSTALERSIQKK